MSFLISVWGFTHPTVGQSKQAGRTAIEAIVELESRIDNLRLRLRSVQNRIAMAPEHSNADEELSEELERSLARLLYEVDKRLKDIGVQDRLKLETLRNSSWLRDQMNARALRTRLLAKLRSRRFELQCLDRPYRKRNTHGGQY